MTTFKMKATSRARATSRRLDDIESRLTRLGIASLSDRELCVLLGLTQQALVKALEEQGLAVVLAANADDLEQRGISATVCHRVLAAAELGRRAFQSEERRPVLSTPLDTARYVRPHLAHAPREEVHVLSLNTRNLLLKHHRAALGTVDSCSVDVREVFAPALAVRAAGIVLVHNHPSGSPEPSTLDIELTHHVAHAGRLLGVRLLDHVIVGALGVVSLSARGALNQRPTALVAAQATSLT
jgi:DNA repair protein RadC